MKIIIYQRPLPSECASGKEFHFLQPFIHTHTRFKSPATSEQLKSSLTPEAQFYQNQTSSPGAHLELYIFPSYLELDHSVNQITDLSIIFTPHILLKHFISTTFSQIFSLSFKLQVSTPYNTVGTTILSYIILFTSIIRDQPFHITLRAPETLPLHSHLQQHPRSCLQLILNT